MTDTAMVLDIISFPSPLGGILLAAKPASGICLLHFFGSAESSLEKGEAVIRKTWPHALLDLNPRATLLHMAKDAILRYFVDATPLPPLPLDVEIGTPFQRKVWEALTSIPFSEKRTYLQIAEGIGKPRSARAIGQACGRNPIPLIIPCHRVVASGGGLGGYSGGLQIKQFLLEVEQRHLKH